ncbi:putative isomerase YbhE [Gloeophyllum trabeum ATCC 11539]|uniref:Putative isomerase YbhE n=1 Tax=Gloeophyllum trabeum (strain ATCC 11539 / FP-39264 / Madison 617) TaxID=670483 RepID=S7PVB6_GLOTA|nr:putative isomerase YbhE [Gloeophyllum trabeum ATCC 11539]EPQ51347.1 putative isomerase YbhE [Gloeophyllum trabeum ATCC 11539]
MVNFTILAGGYTAFVASYLFDSDASTLSLLNQSPTGPSPSWITLHPFNSSILYAVNEVTEGALQSYVVGPEGALAGPVDTIPSGGDAPAYCGALSSGQVAVMNYNSGNGKIIPVESGGLVFDKSARVVTFPPPEGGVSHPHEAIQDGDEVLVPDLGGDKVWRLAQNGSAGEWAIQGLIEQPKGSGPRHAVVNDGYFYVLHELASTLTAQALPKAPNGSSPLLSNESTLPPTYPSGSAFAAGEILLSPKSPAFPEQYIYTSNRNTGTLDARGDTIVVWAMQSDGSVRQVKQVYTGLDQIRGMMLSTGADGAGEYLVAAGFAGTAGVQVYKCVRGGADLQLVATNADIPTRTSFVWLPL